MGGSGAYNLYNEVTGISICHEPLYITSCGYWRGEDPLASALALFLIDLCLMIIITRFLYFIFRPLKQCRFVVEILAGIILGPSVLGRSKAWESVMFPGWIENLIRTMAYLGMTFFLFLTSVKMNPKLILTTGKKPIIIAFIGMAVPLGLVTAAIFGLSKNIPEKIINGPFLVFIPASLAVTGFPNLAQTLTEFDLLNSELGQLALNASLINDYFGWFFMALFTGLDQSQRKPLTTLWSLLSLGALLVFIVFVIRPWMKWIVRRVPMGGQVREEYLVTILLGSLALALVSDMIGATVAFGPMILGLATPNGPPLGSALIDSTELIVMEVFVPMMFVMSGMRTDLSVFTEFTKWASLVAVFFVGYLAKLMATMITGLFFDMQIRSSFVLGLIMNIKGVVEIMTFLSLWNGGLLDDKGYSTTILCTIFLMAILTPILSYLYDPLSRQISVFDRRTISQARSSDMLRVLTCVHSEDPVPYFINLLGTLNVTDPTVTINIYMINLVELQGRAIPVLIRHTAEEDLDDPATKAFINYSDRTNGRVTLKAFTTISPYRTMHQDICKVAEENLVSMIILSFCVKEKVTKADYAVRTMTPTVITNSSCSVGILIHDIPIFGRPMHRIGVVFWGGPDDKEALSFSSYMANGGGVTVTVHRYVQTTSNQNEEETTMDDDAILEFKARTIKYNDGCNLESQKVTVIETMVNDQAQTIETIRSFGEHYDLLIVGRSQRTLSDVMTEWSEYPELGVFGDMMASSKTLKTCPVLVVHSNDTDSDSLGEEN